MYVICFYWQGDRWQTEDHKDPDGYINEQQVHMDRAGRIDNSLPSTYIDKLYCGVKRHTSKPFKFICFTNEDIQVNDHVEIRQFPLVSRCGVLPRMYMYSREAGLMGEQVLCLDLDVVIVGSLKPLMDYEGMFCTRSKFKPGEEYKLDGDIMSFRACQENENRFWKPFIEDVDAAEKLTQGRERYWVRHVAGDIAERWDVVAPGTVLSYKRHITRQKRIPEGAAIVSCHGVPRPHQIKDSWIKEYWP